MYIPSHTEEERTDNRAVCAIGNEKLDDHEWFQDDLVHGCPKLFGMGTRQGLSSGWKVWILVGFRLESGGPLQSRVL